MRGLKFSGKRLSTVRRLFPQVRECSVYSIQPSTSRGCVAHSSEAVRPTLPPRDAQRSPQHTPDPKPTGSPCWEGAPLPSSPTFLPLPRPRRSRSEEPTGPTSGPYRPPGPWRGAAAPGERCKSPRLPRAGGRTRPARAGR